jgi:hypothetical protein
MKIPVFVSSPTLLNIDQETSMNIVLEAIDRFELEPRTLGRSDYPTELPLREVYVISKHCAVGSYWDSNNLRRVLAHGNEARKKRMLLKLAAR